MTTSHDTVEVWGQLVRETDDAVLLRVEGGEEIWFPKSQVEQGYGSDDENNTWTMPAWLALKKGVI